VILLIAAFFSGHGGAACGGYGIPDRTAPDDPLRGGGGCGGSAMPGATHGTWAIAQSRETQCGLQNLC